MAKVILIMATIGMIFLAGCLTTGYEHKIYDYNGKLKEVVRLDYDKAMATSTITDCNLVLSDGARLSFKKSAFIYDGNDFIKLGQGISASGIPTLFIPK